MDAHGMPLKSDGVWPDFDPTQDLADSLTTLAGARYSRTECYWPLETCHRGRVRRGLCPKHYAAAVKMRRANRAAS